MTAKLLLTRLNSSDSAQPLTPAPSACNVEFADPRKLPFVDLATRGELPHLYKAHASYFVTFRLLDAVRLTSGGSRAHSDRIEEIAGKAEPPLTAGACILARPEIGRTVRDAMLHFAGDRYLLHAWCVMPNHVHAVLTPLAPWPLNSILHSWKSYSAREINRAIGGSGSVWERESFDHVIRSIDQLEGFVRYVEQNPVVAGLCRQAADWPLSSARGRPPQR